MKHLTNSVIKAAHTAASQMTADIRASALAKGWHPDVVDNMHVKYHEGTFKVDIHPDYKERAFTHEFGNESTRPTAVLRNHEGQTHKAEKAFSTSLKVHLGGKL